MSNPSQPAFPGIEGAGMTLRQWYAGQALPMIASDPEMFENCLDRAKKSGLGITQYIARCAFQMADAMIAEGGE